MRQFMQGIFVIFIVFLGGLNAFESADLPKFQVENGKTIIMSRNELKEKALLMCYGFDLDNTKEAQLIKVLSDLIYETFYDAEKNQYKNYIDWLQYDLRIGEIKFAYSNKDFNFNLYVNIILKLFLRF